jgi:hypothetical protein
MPVLIDDIVMKDSSNVERTVIDTNGRLYSFSTNFSPGSQFYVDSGSGSNSNDGSSWSKAVATLDYAIGLCTANSGDVIFIAPGHAETFSTTGTKITFDVAGITIIGLGYGASRPTFTFSHTGATMVSTANSVTIQNILLVTGVDLLTTFCTISGTDFTLVDVETRDTNDVEVVDAFITTAAADRLKVIRHFHNGYVGGDANARVFKLVGCDSGYFEDCKFMTKVTTAVINFATTACTKIIVKNCEFYVASTTNFSKTVVDTITGSTWEVTGCFDLGAGSSFSGGSGASLAGDDISVVAANALLIKTETDKIPAEVIKTAAIKTETDKIPAEVVKTAAIQQQVARTCAKKTAATPVTQNLFTVAGGAVRVLAIVGHITTEIAAGANNAKLVHTSTGGSAVDLCATADIASMAIRKLLTITGVAANAIALSAAEGVVVSAVATTPLILTPGILSLNCSGGTTGVIDWYIEYEPLASGATIVPA